MLIGTRGRRWALVLAAIAALLLSGIDTATAATAHPKKKMTHASRQVPKSTATPTSETPSSRY